MIEIRPRVYVTPWGTASQTPEIRALNAEQQYLVDLVHAWASRRAESVPVPGGVSVERVCDALRAHNVESLLVPYLPEAVRSEHLAQQVALSRSRTDLLLLEFERLVPVLKDPACDPVLLKGGALALNHYRRPSDRWFLDLDVLVPRREVDNVCRRLIAAGYRHLQGLRDPAFYDKHHLHRIMLGPQGSVVEVHWDLTLPGSVYRYDVRKVFERATTATLGCHEVKCAAPIDQVLHGVYQNIADGFVDLRRITDLVLLTRSFDNSDWSDLVAEARNTGLASALWLSLHNMKYIAGVFAPPFVLAELEPGAALRRTLTGLHVARGCLTRQAEHTGDYVSMLHILLTPGPLLRLREMARSVWVGEAMLMDQGHRYENLPGFGHRTIVGLRQFKSLLVISWRASWALLTG